MHNYRLYSWYGIVHFTEAVDAPYEFAAVEGKNYSAAGRPFEGWERS